MKDKKRIVFKIGSSSLTGAAGSAINENALHRLALIAGEAKVAGNEILIVSSGAIAAGLKPLGLTQRPKDLATAQAAASIGQGLLIGKYIEKFSQQGIIASQVLITMEDVIRKSHYLNVQRTLTRLLDLGVVPIINENDSVGTHEIRMGDNDRIAALIAHLVKADQLILITDVDGLYDRPPSEVGSQLIKEVVDFKSLHHNKITGAGSAGVGSGGMRTKVEAARIASAAGISTHLINLGKLDNLMHGGEVGTRFLASQNKQPSRLFWLEHAASVEGKLIIDEGAKSALLERGKSLLPVGVTSFEGDFDEGDTVLISDQNDQPIARGIVAYPASELNKLIGKNTKDLSREFGVEYERELVHRDELVILESSAR
jgi:glutamate 5-kinase